jgi:hypothetical protein
VTHALFQAPDVGLIAPDLVIYLDVQPEVFCLHSLFLTGMFTLTWSMLFHHEGVLDFFQLLFLWCLIHLTSVTLFTHCRIMPIVQP